MNFAPMRRRLYSEILRLSGRASQIHFLNDLRARQFDAADIVEAEHDVRLGRMLRVAFEQVPYYRALLEEKGLQAPDLSADPRKVLSLLPLLDKSILREQIEALKAGDLEQRSWRYNTSGGSTGEPVRFVQDAVYHDAGMASKRLFDEWSGFHLGDPKVVLWGSERDLLVGRDTWRSRMGRWARNECPLNAFRMGAEDMHQFVDAINRMQPVQLLSYAQSVFELARFIDREGLQIYSPVAVMTSAGTLFPHMRETIEAAFRAPVFNRYGSREVGDIACECEQHQGLHVNPYTHHLEILRDDGSPCEPGEVGEIVVTSLTNEAMPLLRYRIGDLAAWAEKPCDCGRHWPLVRSVSGRVNSIIRTPKGSFDSAALSALFYFKDKGKKELFSSFSNYQLVQESEASFLLRVVVREQDLWESERALLLEKLQRTFGQTVNIIIKVQEKIEPSRSGKHLYIYSEVQ